MLVVISVAILFTALGAALAYVLALVNTKYPLLKKHRDAVEAPAMTMMPCSSVFPLTNSSPNVSVKYEEEHDVRLIVINHSHSESMYGIISTTPSLSLADSSKLQKILESTPDDKTIHLVLRSQGGDLQATEIILHALKTHKGEVHVFVPEYAQSAATMIALAGTHLHMGKNAFLTSVDPQISMFSAYTIVDFVNKLQNDSGMLVTLAKLIKPTAEAAIQRAEALLFMTIGSIPDVLKGKNGHDKPLFVSDVEAFRKVQVGIPEDLQSILDDIDKPQKFRL